MYSIKHRPLYKSLDKSNSLGDTWIIFSPGCTNHCTLSLNCCAVCQHLSASAVSIKYSPGTCDMLRVRSCLVHASHSSLAHACIKLSLPLPPSFKDCCSRSVACVQVQESTMQCGSPGFYCSQCIQSLPVTY